RVRERVRLLHLGGHAPRSDGGHFVFQAEDRIRDRNVTGVQTCALPIFGCRFTIFSFTFIFPISCCDFVFISSNSTSTYYRWKLRSEERRVGKECRDGGRRFPCSDSERGGMEQLGGDAQESDAERHAVDL